MSLSTELLEHNGKYKDTFTTDEYQQWEDEHYAIMNKFNLITLEEIQ